MADKDDLKETHDYHLDVPVKNPVFELRGSNSLDWGMKNRLSNIFDPRTNRTVMLAVDHGYFLGPTSGLERVDVTIVPLLPWADTLMCTRGILRSTIPPSFTKGVVLRASGGPSILKELSNEEIAVDIEDAVAVERGRGGGAGVHRRRVRDAVRPQHDASGRRGQPVRCPRARRDRRGEGHGTGRQVHAACLADLRGAWRFVREDVLRPRRLRDGDRVVPRSHRDRGRKEDLRARSAPDGPRRGAERRRRCRHGAEHLPIREPRSR